MQRVIHIMVVEDDVLDQMEIKRTLERRGILHRLTIASTGEEALDKLKACDHAPDELPDIILLDLDLPKMNGLDVHALLQEHRLWRKIKAFVLTGASRREEIEAAIQPGIAGIITKPLRLENRLSSDSFNLMIDLMNI